MKQINKLLQTYFINVVCAQNMLFRSGVNTNTIWDLYLENFKEDDDPVWRDPQKSLHDCQNCNNFIRRYGNIIGITKEGTLVSMFDIYKELDKDNEYYAPFKRMSKSLTSNGISNVFFETFDELNSLPYEKTNKTQELYRLGLEKNFKQWDQQTVDAHTLKPCKVGEITEFHHFSIQLPKEFVNKTGKSIDAIVGDYRNKYNLFKSSVTIIPIDTLDLVIDLINQGSLLNGNAYLKNIKDFKKYLQEVEKSTWNREILYWYMTYTMNSPTQYGFKNTLIGVLCTELAEGMELNKACENWNKRVDPANYKNVTAPVTKKMMQQAAKEFKALGYSESALIRTLAKLDDIKLTEIKHMNVDAETDSNKSVSIFDSAPTQSKKSTRHKRSEFDKVEEISIEKFMENIVPTASSIEAYVENRHADNFVAITKSKDPDDITDLFKWNNGYSWTYRNNLTGKSEIKDAVKSQGGGVDGVLRFSIMWSEGDSIDNSDLDAHCRAGSSGKYDHIYFSDRRGYITGGVLDIDITGPLNHKRNSKKVVENITFGELSKLKDKTFKFFVNQYSARNSKGFKAEIEFNGELHEYTYDRSVSGNVDVAIVTVDKNGNFDIEHNLPSSSSEKNIWGINTQNFHKINMLSLSPNYWNDNKVGHKHYMFMLENCKADIPLKGFHNDNLNPKLNKIRKAMSVLSNTAIIKDPDKIDHLAGIGFNSTVRDELIVKVKGSHQRMMKIKF